MVGCRPLSGASRMRKATLFRRGNRRGLAYRRIANDQVRESGCSRWAVILDLPRGGGKTAADVIAKRDTVAAELGVDEIQVIMSRVRAAAGGHADRLSRSRTGTHGNVSSVDYFASQPCNGWIEVNTGEVVLQSSVAELVDCADLA